MEEQKVDSIYNLIPLEQGGTDNRQGIDFQDHVAAEFCLDMLLGTEIAEVWCETQDDITLILKINEITAIEFVQVKSNTSFNAWSVANLCDRKQKGAGHSILEKSLANDRCTEKCCFRMITAQSINNELEYLKYDISAASRQPKLDSFNKLLDPFESLKEEVEKKVGGFKSANGNDHNFWIENTKWEVRYDSDSVINSAVLKLRKYLEQEGFNVSGEQVDELYNRLVAKTYKAGLAKYKVDPEKKRIKKEDLLSWFTATTNETLHPAMGKSERMQAKMEAALLPDETIEAAKEQRRRYRQEVLQPKYLTVEERDLVEGELLARLLRLKSSLDTGKITLSAPEFHDYCLEQLEEFQKFLPTESIVPLHFLQGNMYDVVNRCHHRFTKKIL